MLNDIVKQWLWQWWWCQWWCQWWWWCQCWCQWWGRGRGNPSTKPTGCVAEKVSKSQIHFFFRVSGYKLRLSPTQVQSAGSKNRKLSNYLMGTKPKTIILGAVHKWRHHFWGVSDRKDASLTAWLWWGDIWWWQRWQQRRRRRSIERMQVWQVLIRAGRGKWRRQGGNPPYPPGATVVFLFLYFL